MQTKAQKICTRQTTALFVFVIALPCFPTFSQSLEPQWARTYRLDPAKFNQASKAVLVPDGLIVAGASANASGDSDYLLLKYDASGQQTWIRRYDSGGGHDDVLRDIAVDANANVFVTGTTDTLKLNSAGEIVWTNHVGGRAILANTNFVYLAGFSDTDFTTAQLENNDVDGKQNWTRTYNGAANDIDVSGALAFTKSGNIVVGGWETVARYPRGLGVDVLIVIGYTPNGTQLFYGSSSSRPINDVTGRDSVSGLYLDSAGAMYLNVNINGNYCLSRFKPDGTHDWTDVDGGALVALTSNDNIHFAGDAGSGPTRYAQIYELTPTHGLNWVQQYKNPLGFSLAYGLAIGPDDMSYVAGPTQGTGAENDLFILQVGANGENRGVSIYGFGNQKSDTPNAVAVDLLGNVYVTGYSTTAEGGTEFLTLKYSAGPKIEAKPSGAMHLEFHTNPGGQYSIEATTDFLNWQSLITNTADLNGLVQFDDTTAPTIPYRFYRGKQP